MPTAYPLLASLTDLYAYGARSDAFGSLTDAQRLAALTSASEKFLGFAASRGDLPLIAWGTDVTESVCHVAAYQLMADLGFNPNDGADKNFVDRYNAAILWWRTVARGESTPPGLIFSTPAVVGSFPKVKSKLQRGW
jgi:phage gp36-like protein